MHRFNKLVVGYTPNLIQINSLKESMELFVSQGESLSSHEDAQTIHGNETLIKEIKWFKGL